VIRGLDHVVFVATDLAQTAADYRRRGFTVQAGGVHAGGVSQNSLVGFSDGSYLELFGFIDLSRARVAAHSWLPVFERGGGWADFALLSDDLAADVAALGELVAKAPADGGRVRPDGREVSWRVARLHAPLPFLIQDVTARDLRVPSGDAAVHPSGVRGVERLVLGAHDVARVTRHYDLLRARGAPDVEIRRAERDGIVDVTFR
jgi:catechol 2,3-dioxygenase-like lactoylglutathione lyase family enzyme